MLSALIVVWRESLEAVLVVGILHAWLGRHGNRAGLRWLGIGVLAGLGLAALLGAGLLALESRLPESGIEGLQTVILFAAAALIVQMTLWMRENSRGLRRELEAGAASALRGGHGIGIALLAALAVGREGAETTLFLYGLLLEQERAQLVQVAAGAAGGLVLGIATFWVLSRGVRWMSWRAFFAASEILLFVFAGALVVSGTDRLVSAGLVAVESAPAWDSGWLLDDNSVAGSLLQQFAGYRAQPNWVELVAWSAYWLALAALVHRARVATGLRAAARRVGIAR